MLISTSGSRLYIAESSVAFSSANWVEIGETEAIGALGVEWDVVTADVMTGCGPDDGPGELAMKGVMRRPEVPLIMANDPTDPGQLLLWRAARSHDSWPFRLVLPDGASIREWFALVVRIGEVFDNANSVMRLQVDLKPTSNVFKNGESLT